MNPFSQQLIDRFLRYMQEQHGVTLTPEEANEWLRVYADTFVAFGRGGRAPARRISARGAPPDDGDLINSTLNENEIN
jgi:hypothetical protein